MSKVRKVQPSGSPQLAIALPLPSTSVESRRAADRGIRDVKRGQESWIDTALDALRGFNAGRSEVTVEAFRAHWLANGGIHPRSHHAWGALGRVAVNRGLLRFIRFEAAKSIATHGHPIRVYAPGAT